MRKTAYFGVAVLPPHQLFLDLLEHARTARLSVNQACDLVLGQLSPATPLGGDYPDGYDTNELFRRDAANHAAVDIKDGSEALLKDLLDHRVGSPATYSICLGFVLVAAGHLPVELALTSPHAEVPERPFVICDGRQIDLFARATGEKTDPSRYRPDKKSHVQIDF